MATLAELTATQQATVDGEAAALVTALENIIILGVLEGNRIGTLQDLGVYLELAIGSSLSTFFQAQRAAGDAVRRTAAPE